MTCIHHKIHEIYENVVTNFTHKKTADYTPAAFLLSYTYYDNN